MIQIKYVVLVLMLGLSQIIFAVPKEYIPENTGVQFTAVGKPAMLKIKGKTEDLKGKITIDAKQLNANLLVNLSTLVTGIATRDTHMKEKYLEVAKFPNAELTIKDLQLPVAFTEIKANLAEQPFKAEMQLHGVKQPIEGIYAVETIDGKVKVTTKFTLKLSDFKIDIPTYIGIKVADKVEVESKFDLKK